MGEQLDDRVAICVNACANIPNPAAIGRVVEEVRSVLAADDMYGTDGAPTLGALREALAELDKEGPA